MLDDLKGMPISPKSQKGEALQGKITVQKSRKLQAQIRCRGNSSTQMLWATWKHLEAVSVMPWNYAESTEAMLQERSYEHMTVT